MPLPTAGFYISFIQYGEGEYEIIFCYFTLFNFGLHRKLLNLCRDDLFSIAEFAWFFYARVTFKALMGGHALSLSDLRSVI
jgi:hypothetical protein